jgi:endonuclease/exonuclease/phosphatase family metal-dependent hydrolase
LNQIKTIAGSTSNVIITGDLNATPSSDAYRTIITNTAFKDAQSITETAHCGPAGTFSTFSISSKMGNRIDYIFVTSKFKVWQHGALTDSNNGFYPSDHLPVLTEVTI